MNLSLYHIEDSVSGYDVWTDWVVAARSRKQALQMHPGGDGFSYNGKWPTKTIATYIGKAALSIHSPEVICASFNAG
jgi:hypothetical protein